MRTSRTALPWLGALLALYLLGPIVAFAIRFAVPGEHGFTEAGLWSSAATSLISASISTAIIVALGVPLAHWLATSESRSSRVVGQLVQLPLALPPVMSGIVLIYLVGPYTPLGELFGGALTDSLAGVVIAQTFVAAPFLVIGARSAFRGVDPSLDRVASGLGHGPTARFFRVAIPAAGDGIRAALVLTWLRALGEYGATALLAYHPYTLPVFVNVQFQGGGLPTTQAPTALALGAAILAIVIGVVPLRRRRAPAVVPAPRPPASDQAPLLSFDVGVRAGRFVLRIAMLSESRRIAVLGASGAGKTLTLQAIAGVRQGAPSTVVVGGEDVGRLRPERRPIGYVAQGGVLLPRRTVWQQAVFGAGAAPAVAAWWLRTLRIDGLADRYPDELSSGQRQRVAIAQVLSREPSVVLLDEPFSALDGPVRDGLRTEFRRLQRERGLTTVVVTHDPEEAAYLADYVIVVDEGRVLQQGPLAEVYRTPASSAVARLVGVRNVNEGVLSSGGALRSGPGAIAAVPAWAGAREERAVFWSARPESVTVDPQGAVAVVVTDVIDLGTAVLVEVALPGGAVLVARSSAGTAVSAGDRTAVDLDPAGISVWDRDG